MREEGMVMGQRSRFEGKTLRLKVTHSRTAHKGQGVSGGSKLKEWQCPAARGLACRASNILNMPLQLLDLGRQACCSQPRASCHIREPNMMPGLCHNREVKMTQSSPKVKLSHQGAQHGARLMSHQRGQNDAEQHEDQAVTLGSSKRC
eukprot:1139293-Pelagomonas_calceolata.AAC.10